MKEPPEGLTAPGGFCLWVFAPDPCGGLDPDRVPVELTLNNENRKLTSGSRSSARGADRLDAAALRILTGSGFPSNQLESVQLTAQNRPQTAAGDKARGRGGQNSTANRHLTTAVLCFSAKTPQMR